MVLFEVTQSFDDDGPAALLFRVSGFQSHDALGPVGQMLNLPLVFQDLLLLPLGDNKTKTKSIIMIMQIKNNNCKPGLIKTEEHTMKQT